MDDFQNIISSSSSIIGLILSLATLITLIYTKYSKSVEKIVKKTVDQALEESRKHIETDLNNSLIEITEELKSMQEKLKYMQDKDRMLIDATMNMARDRIHEAYRYHTSHNIIDAHSLFCIEELYKSYVELGGNSFVEEEVKALRRLPLEK